jgi:hypothetical protein
MCRGEEKAGMEDDGRCRALSGHFFLFHQVSLLQDPSISSAAPPPPPGSHQQGKGASSLLDVVMAEEGIELVLIDNILGGLRCFSTLASACSSSSSYTACSSSSSYIACSSSSSYIACSPPAALPDNPRRRPGKTKHKAKNQEENLKKSNNNQI